MTWAVGLALLAVAVVATGAWLLARPRPEPFEAGGAVDGADDGADLGPAAEDGGWQVPARDADGFTPQLRGYRMDQVDTVVDALEHRIATHDLAIAALRGGPGPEPVVPGDTVPTMTSSPGEPRAATTDAGPEPAPEDEPPPRPGPAAGRTDDPGCRTPHTAAPVRPAGTGGLPPDRHAPAVRPRAGPARRIPLPGGPGPAGVRVVLRGHRAQPRDALQPALQRPPELPRRASTSWPTPPSSGSGIPLAPLTLLAGPQLTFLARRAARAGAHGIRVVLAVPPPARRAPARRRARRRLRRLRPGHGLARQRPPQLRRAVPPPPHRRPGLRLADGDRRVRDGVVLGLLVAWQVFIGEEALLLAALGIARRRLCSSSRTAGVDLRRLLPGVAIGAAVCLAVVAVPLWWQFTGPQSYSSIYHPPAGNDLAAAVGPGHPQHRRRPVGLGGLSMNRTEENSFFGVPLLLAAARRHGAVLAPPGRPGARAAVVVVACWLSLGEEVVLHGRPDRHPGSVGPARARCRSSRTSCPPGSPSSRSRRSGALLALGIEAVRVRGRGRYAGHAGAGPRASPAVGGRRVVLAARPSHPARRRPAARRAVLLRRRRVARLGRRGRVGARRAAHRRRGRARDGVAGAGPVGLPARGRATSSVPTPRPSGAASTAPPRPRLTSWLVELAESGVARRPPTRQGRAVPGGPAGRTRRRGRAARRAPRRPGAADLR